MTSAQPLTVTVIMPVRNEGDFIARSVGAALAQDYDGPLEVLVVDGMSTDNTRDEVKQLAARDDRVTLLDNPAHIVPSSLNIGLASAHGEVIIRVDGHCVIPVDYVRRCIDLLAKTDAACVGGVLDTVGSDAVARAIARAQSSRFGVGSAAFRTGSGEARAVDTLAFGAYRREVFDQLGGFDEELVRNQDDEFNLRLVQSGRTIWLDPSIHTTYYSRASLKGLWRQYYQYGYYKVRVIQKRGGVGSWRQLVPAGFVLGLVASALIAAMSRRGRWLGAVALPYAAALSMATAVEGRDDHETRPHLPAAFLILHVAYGLGFLHGLVAWRSRSSGRDAR